MFRAAERVPDRYSEAGNGLLELVGDGADNTRQILDCGRYDVDRRGARLDLEDQLEPRYCDVTKKPKRDGHRSVRPPAGGRREPEL